MNSLTSSEGSHLSSHFSHVYIYIYITIEFSELGFTPIISPFASNSGRHGFLRTCRFLFAILQAVRRDLLPRIYALSAIDDVCLSTRGAHLCDEVICDINDDY